MQRSSLFNITTFNVSSVVVLQKQVMSISAATKCAVLGIGYPKIQKKYKKAENESTVIFYYNIVFFLYAGDNIRSTASLQLYTSIINTSRFEAFELQYDVHLQS